MAEPIRILLQTTIPTDEDDWHVGRFSMLRRHLEGLRDANGDVMFEVTARDRATIGFSDPILSRLPRYWFDQLWLFAVDEGDGLDDEDCAGIDAFRRSGRGLLVTRDHMDLGSSVCGVPEVGAAHHFHSRNQEPDEARRVRDDPDTQAISWPNYHSGSNGDFQEIAVEGPAHPLLGDPASPTGLVRFLPSHPHEGAISAPCGDPSARVIAKGTSIATGADFNLAVAFERTHAAGPAVAQSTFHHFVDLNWDPACGSPPFVIEPPGDAIVRSPEAQASIRRYVANLACWLSDLEPLASMDGLVASSRG